MRPAGGPAVFLYEALILMKHAILPIFIPHYGCAHRCVFCNQVKITGIETTMDGAQVEALLKRQLARSAQPRFIEAAFYGGSFTALPIATQNELLRPASALLREGRLHAIRVSTRPDAISDAVLQNLTAFGVGTIELGVQSLDDAVLRRAGRGHTADDVRRAVEFIRRYPFRLGIQLMPGLPGDTRRTMFATLQKAIQFQPDMARLYPTGVLENTRLAKMYRAGSYAPLPLAEAVAICAAMKLELERHAILVIRTGLQAAENLAYGKALLAGPYHPSFGEMVESYIFLAGVKNVLDGIDCAGKNVALFHAAKDASKLRGLKNSNIKLLKRRYALAELSCRAGNLPEGSLELWLDGRVYRVRRFDVLLHGDESCIM